MTAKKESYSYIAGKKGRNRVRLFDRGGTLFVEFKDCGKKKRLSLNHGDRERGEEKAEELALELRKAADAKPKAEPLTLQTLFDKYDKEKTRTKSAQVQAHDRFALALFAQCWGGDVEVSDLSSTDWDRYIEQRRSGALTGTPVRNRIIESDMRLILAVMNWGETVREGGRFLVERNPFRKLPVPSEMNPRRPQVSEAEYQKLRQAAVTFGPEVELFLLFAHESGHRSNSIRQLRWSDIDTETALVTWRAENDKLGYQHATGLTPGLVGSLIAARPSEAGNIPVFPSAIMKRHVVGTWWKRLERKAGIARVNGRGWHCFRRKFASDLVDEPLTVTRDLGGWKDTMTLTKCYIKPDAERMKQALARRSERRSDNNGHQERTPPAVTAG